METRPRDLVVPRNWPDRIVKIIYTAGVFDLLHYGHRHILKQSRELGNRLIVGVVANADYKGVTPSWSLDRRVAEVSALPEVDLVVVQPSTDPTPVLNRLDWMGLRPAAMTHGGDWDRLLEGHETLDTLGIEWVKVPLVSDISSTKIRESLNLLREGVDLP